MGIEERRTYSQQQHAFRQVIDTAAASYVGNKTLMFLDQGLDELDERTYCPTCPAALICAAAGLELSKLAPDTARGAGTGRRKDALKTLSHLGIKATLHEEDICFGAVIRSIDNGVLLPAAQEQSQDDPLTPFSLVWLADRVRSFMQDAAGRLQSGQRI